MSSFSIENPIPSNIELDINAEDFFKNESPKIDIALKNFLAKFMAELITTDATGGLNLPQRTLFIARNFSTLINSFELLDVTAWITTYTSNESLLVATDLQSEDIRKYEDLYNLTMRAKLRGGKITKLFGKSFFDVSRCFEKISELLLQKIGEDNEDLGQQFIKSFENSLQDPSSSYYELTWTTNYKETLYKNITERIDGIRKRSDELETDTRNQLKNAVLTLRQNIQVNANDVEENERDSDSNSDN